MVIPILVEDEPSRTDQAAKLKLEEGSTFDVGDESAPRA
jgi:hypothetical protein